jgi:hypothetical protein
MDAQEVMSNSSVQFLQDRGLSIIDDALGIVIFATIGVAYRWFSKKTFLVRYSLQTKLTVALIVIAVACFTALALKLSPVLILATGFVGFAFVIFWTLSDVAKVGITNAYLTTRQGISAEASLKQVRKDLSFLGIGAKKLTDSPEFEKMLQRCKESGGTVRFLLSHPDNKALEEVAKRNDRDDLSYRSRVKESIREIFSKTSRSGINFEVRTYDLHQKIALPHFRLMFIDDKLCIFSQVFWSKGEGLDNPQLILTKSKGAIEGSLFWGYRQYFTDLWDHADTKLVDQAVLDSWTA